MPDKIQMVMGRVTELPDGQQAIEPIHGEVVMGYQKRVLELLRAARAYTDQPSAHTLSELKQAAHNLDR